MKSSSYSRVSDYRSEWKEFWLIFRLHPSQFQSFNSNFLIWNPNQHQQFTPSLMYITHMHIYIQKYIYIYKTIYLIIYINIFHVLFTHDSIYISFWKTSSQLSMTSRSVEICLMVSEPWAWIQPPSSPVKIQSKSPTKVKGGNFQPRSERKCQDVLPAYFQCLEFGGPSVTVPFLCQMTFCESSIPLCWVDLP